jgi:tetratricopeptide (TPR) repeat protein
LAQRLTNLAETSIKRLFKVTASHEAEDLWDRMDRSLDQIGRRELREIGTRFLVHGSVAAERGDTSIELHVILQSGDRRRAGTIHMRGDRNLGQTGYHLGRNIVSIVAPNRQSEYRGGLLSEVDEAVRAYLDGLEAFKRNAFQAATDEFQQAQSLDSTFGLAAWWFHNSFRWLMTGGPPQVDLWQLLEAQGDDLPELDRMLIEAQLEPTLTLRLDAYAETVRRYPRDAYAFFLYADEMQTRGSLIGIPLDSSTSQLERAADMDSTFGPIQLGLIRSYVRLGQSEEALEAMNRYERVYVETEDIRPTHHPNFLQLLIGARFSPAAVEEQMQVLLGDPENSEVVLRRFRIVAQFDLAPWQSDLAGGFLEATSQEPAVRAHLHEGRGLALIGLGRIAEGMWHIDSAAMLWGTDEARLEAAEWRVVTSALGFPGVGPDEVERGRNMLLALLADSANRSRAAWALGVDAAVSGDRDATGRWLDSLSATPADTTAARLATSLLSVDLGSRGMYQEALDLSRELLQYDSAGRGGDPFTRAALHLKRAEWYDSLDKPDEADGARLWYEHFEFLGFRAREAQPAEIDWALSPYARLLRARAAREIGDHDKACTHFVRLTELWAAADPAYAPLMSEAEEYVRQRCR